MWYYWAYEGEILISYFKALISETDFMNNEKNELILLKYRILLSSNLNKIHKKSGKFS